MKRDPGFQEALAKRGVTDFEAVQVDAWPAGNFGAPEEQDRRLARCLAFVRPRPGDSEWAHPVDGLIVLVDLTTLEVLRIDDHGVVPIPEESGNFDVEAATAGGRRLRDDIRPLEITQPEGPSFELDGRVLRWQNWELHVGFTPARGTGPQPGRLPRPGTAAADPLPRLALGDGRPLRRPEPDAFLQERLRRGRERRRDRRVAADPRLRLPRRDPLPRRRGRQRRRRAGRDPERDLHPRGGHRGALAPHRVAKRRGRGPPRPPARRSHRSRRSATTTTASSGTCIRTARSTTR